MDHPKRPSDKTYSEVMNEWAAQRNFVKGNRSRLLHPPWDAHPAAKFFGYLGRLLVVIAIPAIIYVFLLRSFAGSKEFNRQLSTGLATTLEAQKAEVLQASWKLDGLLSVKELKATGAPGAFYEKLTATNIGTRIPIPAIFHRAWVLHRVSLENLDLRLRSGALGELPEYESPTEDQIHLPSLPTPEAPPKTGALTVPASRVMRAGYGIDPDFSILRINAVQVARLNATWGSGPATTGGLTEMQTDLVRTAAGWVISGNGGTFRQGWLGGLKLEKLAAEVLSGEAVIKEAAFTPGGGGSAVLNGQVKLGEFPEVDAGLKLEKVPVQNFVSVAAASLFTAEASGTVKLSGTLNRSTGIRMDGSLTLLSGRIHGLPVLKALHQLTGEDQFRLLSITSGKVDFASQGSEEHGGQIVEIKAFEADCGPLARLKGSYRQEQIREGGDLSGATAVERLKVAGEIRFGIPARVAAKLKPSTVGRFFKADAEGWFWLTLPVGAPFSSSWTRDVAAEMLKADATPP